VQEGCKIRRIYGILGYTRRDKLFIFVSVGVFHPLSRRIVSTTHAPLRAVKIRGLLIILSGAPDYQVRLSLWRGWLRWFKTRKHLVRATSREWARRATQHKEATRRTGSVRLKRVSRHVYPTLSSVVLPTMTATRSRNRLRPSESRTSMSWLPGRSANFFALSILSAKPPST
jgi:hypothetical protein